MAKSLAGYMHFVWASLIKQGQMGAILPSQRFLVAKMIAPIPESYDGQILELGAGNGSLTVRLAQERPRARILACEINPTLANANRLNLSGTGLNTRVEVISDSAENLLSEMAGRNAKNVDYIVSGVPIGNFGRKRTMALIDLISGNLRPGGMYIQYQHFLADHRKIKAKFASMQTIPVLLNFPPAFVYYAKK
jgi:phospholipid N-methyltransferase